MGWGDELVASGLARGARQRGERIAFGFDGKIRWSKEAREIFRGNPNVAAPGSEGATDLRWIPHCQGARLNTAGVVDAGRRWRWLPFRPVPGEVFFDRAEIAYAQAQPAGFVVIEPRTKAVWADNKQWPQDRYRAIAMKLRKRGFRVVQFSGDTRPVDGCGEVIRTFNFRHALALLSRAALYIGPEGGLHHGAAAVGTKAVVIFGGWPDPMSSGYDHHVNLAAPDAGCGTIKRCNHCRAAMERISVYHVLEAALAELDR